MNKSWLAFKQSSWIQVFFVVTSRKKDEKGIRGWIGISFHQPENKSGTEIRVVGWRPRRKFEPKTLQVFTSWEARIWIPFFNFAWEFSDSICSENGSEISKIPIQYGYDIYVTRVLPSMPDRTHVVVTAMLVYKIREEMECTPKKNECRKVVFQPSFLRGYVRLQFTTAFFHIFGELSDVKLRFAWADLAIK